MNDLLGKVSTTGMGHIETIVVWIHAGYMPIFNLYTPNTITATEPLLVVLISIV